MSVPLFPGVCDGEGEGHKQAYPEQRQGYRGKLRVNRGGEAGAEPRGREREDHGGLGGLAKPRVLAVVFGGSAGTRDGVAVHDGDPHERDGERKGAQDEDEERPPPGQTPVLQAAGDRRGEAVAGVVVVEVQPDFANAMSVQTECKT